MSFRIGKSEVRLGMVIKLAGAFCAFLIGAGFATGQEIMQYFTNFGFIPAIGVMIVNCIVGAWTASAVMNLGNESRDSMGLNSYKNLCGKYLGTFLSYFIPVFMFLTLVIMIAGCGSTFNQLFGCPNWVGCVVMAVVTTVIVLLGLANVIDTIGFIGPTIIVITMVMSITVLAQNGLDFETYQNYLDTHELYLAADSWFMSGMLYALWNLVMCLPFMSAMGSKAQNKTEVVCGSVFGNILFTIATFFLVSAEASQIESIGELSIPALEMAQKIAPAFGIIYAIVLCAAIFTTAVPLMWSVTARLAKEKTIKFAVIAIIIAILGIFGGQLPFEQLINYIYPLIGWVGFLEFICIIWREIKMFRAWRAGEPLAPHKDEKDQIEKKNSK